jgi:hypothetical protein
MSRSKMKFATGTVTSTTQRRCAYCPALFPLHTCDGSGGDYTVLRLDVTPAKVEYLDHELAGPVDDEHTIGIGFREFVLGWANLGFPQCEYHSCWVNPQTRQPADTSREADVWRGWLIVP